jgi:hypothetical protein
VGGVCVCVWAGVCVGGRIRASVRRAGDDSHPQDGEIVGRGERARRAGKPLLPPPPEGCTRRGGGELKPQEGCAASFLGRIMPPGKQTGWGRDAPRGGRPPGPARGPWRDLGAFGRPLWAFLAASQIRPFPRGRLTPVNAPVNAVNGATLNVTYIRKINRKWSPSHDERPARSQPRSRAVAQPSDRRGRALQAKAAMIEKPSHLTGGDVSSLLDSMAGQDPGSTQVESVSALCHCLSPPPPVATPAAD